MSDISIEIAELKERIASVRENLRGLIERGAALSGAADEDLGQERIAEQETELSALLQRCRELEKSVRSSGSPIQVDVEITQEHSRAKRALPDGGGSLKRRVDWRRS